jgi:hypothetical protein
MDFYNENYDSDMLRRNTVCTCKMYIVCDSCINDYDSQGVK